MCSGCSDYFEGDSEDGDPDDDRVPEREASWPGGLAMGRYGLGEVRNDLAKGATGDGDDYEVLVSADFIVERRTIRSNRRAVSSPGAPEGVGSRQEKRGNCEHSLLASANSYRTRSQFELKRPEGSVAGGRCLMLWGLAGATVLGLALWLTVG